MVKSWGLVTAPLDRARAVLWLRQRAGWWELRSLVEELSHCQVAALQKGAGSNTLTSLGLQISRGCLLLAESSWKPEGWWGLWRTGSWRDWDGKWICRRVNGNYPVCVRSSADPCKMTEGRKHWFPSTLCPLPTFTWHLRSSATLFLFLIRWGLGDFFKSSPVLWKMIPYLSEQKSAC